MYTSATNKNHSYTATRGENDAENMSLKTIKVIFGNFGNINLLTTTASTPRHGTMCSHHYKSTKVWPCSPLGDLYRTPSRCLPGPS